MTEERVPRGGESLVPARPLVGFIPTGMIAIVLWNVREW